MTKQSITFLGLLALLFSLIPQSAVAYDAVDLETLRSWVDTYNEETVLLPEGSSERSWSNWDCRRTLHWLGDFNWDGQINGTDYQILQDQWRNVGCFWRGLAGIVRWEADIDQTDPDGYRGPTNCRVDSTDMNIMAIHFGRYSCVE